MTKVNWTKPAGLAALLLALSTTAYWLEYKHKPKLQSAEEQTKKVFNLTDTQVKNIVLHDTAGQTIDLRCSDVTAQLCKPGDNSKWELTAPLKLKADDANVNALVSSLNNLTVSETIDLKEETPEKRTALLRDYGLDAKSLAASTARKIEVTTPKGTTAFYLGLNHPIGDSIFSLAEDVPAGQKPSGKADVNKVYLVPTFFKANFDHDLSYWRDKKLMTASANEIESFKLVGSKANLSGLRKDGQWTIKPAQGDAFSGDIENIDNVLTSATYLNAQGFVADRKSDPKAQAALKGAKPVLTLTVQQEKGSSKEAPAPITLTLYQKPGVTEIYATVSNLDPLFKLDAPSRDRLDKPTKEFRLSKLITSMERFTLKRLAFSSKALGNTPLILKDVNGKWTAEGEKMEVNHDKAQTLLDHLSGNRIQEFLPESALPAGEAEGLTIQLGNDKTDNQRKFVFWPNGDNLYAKDLNSGKKEGFQVNHTIAKDLPWTRDFFKKTAPVADSK